MSFHFYLSDGSRSFLANDRRASDENLVDKILPAGDGFVSCTGCINFARSYAQWAGSQARIDFATSAAFCRRAWPEMSAGFAERDKPEGWQNIHLIVTHKGGVYSINHHPDGGDNFQHYAIDNFVCNRLAENDLQIVRKHLRSADLNNMTVVCDRLYRELHEINYRVSAEWQGYASSDFHSRRTQ